MSFIVENAVTSGKGGNNSGVQIDWDALNSSVIEQAGLQERETLVGVISHVIDLGTHPQPDAEFVFTGTLEEEEEIEDEYSGTYFKDGKDQSGNAVRLRCWEQPDVQHITLAVDFPDIMIDRSEFFEGSEPKPLRLYLGGQFYSQEHGMVVGRMYPLRLSKTGGFNEKSSLTKMAIAAKIVKAGEEFKAVQLGELIGKSLQFEAQVFMKAAKNGKSYYTEYIRFVGGLSRGMKETELSVPTSVITFNGDNDENSVLDLRNHVKNTIKAAKNYQGSKIQAILDSEKSDYSEESVDTEVEKKKPVAKQPVIEDVELDEDDFEDIPF